MVRLVQTTADGVDVALAQIAAHTPPDAVFYVLVVGRWCPDCHRADPNVHAAAAKHLGADTALLEVDVGAREHYKDAAFPLRHHAQFRLQRIPTLYRWTRSGPTHRLVEGELFDAANVARFLSGDAFGTPAAQL